MTPPAACPSGKSPAATTFTAAWSARHCRTAGPPPRKQAARPARAINPVRDILDELAGEPCTIWEIWTTVTDEHGSDALYAAIRDYIRTRRLARQPGPPPDQAIARR